MDYSVMSSVFNAAPIDSQNLRACLDIRPYHFGQGHLNRERALQLWEQIIGNEDSCGHVAISRKASGSSEVVAVGIAVFVTNEFAEAELARPQPGLNARILGAQSAGKSVLTDYRYLARANAAAVLQQVIMISSTKGELLTRDEDTMVRSMLARSYAELFAGYRVQRMLTEINGRADMAALAGYPSIRIVTRYEDYYDKHDRNAGDSVLCVAVGESFKEDPSSLAAPIYLSQPAPRFGLNRGEKDLLKGSLSGLDDTQLAAALCRTESALNDVGVASLKKYQTSILICVQTRKDPCVDRKGGIASSTISESILKSFAHSL